MAGWSFCMSHNRLQMVMMCALTAWLSQAAGTGCRVFLWKGVNFCHFASSVMRLCGVVFLLLMLGTLCLGPDLFRVSVRLFSTISWFMVLTFSLSHFSFLPVVISAPLDAFSQGAEE